MIRDRIKEIKEAIASACRRAGRDPAEVTVVAVSKNRSQEDILTVLDCGITDIGENRVQEAMIKFNKLKRGRWHMVGHLQSNKVKEALQIFDLIHSVDSLKLAKEIDRQAQKINKIQRILVEVKTSHEDSKFGLYPENAIEAMIEIAALKNTELQGLMTIAPLTANASQAKPYFQVLKSLFDKYNSLSGIKNKLSILSMGMSDDYIAAIESGSNMVRLGRAIFESQK